MNISDVEYDEVVINLKVIASITVNSKLYTKGPLLNLEQDSYIPQSVRRWYRQDSRDDAIKKIDRVITKSITFSRNPAILKYLKEAKAGILNMKDTYSLCIQTVARLDTILDKISLHLDDNVRDPRTNNDKGQNDTIKGDQIIDDIEQTIYHLDSPTVEMTDEKNKNDKGKNEKGKNDKGKDNK